MIPVIVLCNMCSFSQQLFILCLPHARHCFKWKDKTVQKKLFGLQNSFSSGRWLSQGWWWQFNTLQTAYAFIVQLFSHFLRDVVLDMLTSSQHKALWNRFVRCITNNLCFYILIFTSIYIFLGYINIDHVWMSGGSENLNSH